MATQVRPYSAPDEKKLMTELWSQKIKDDPLAFVLFTFPWGQPGTPLERFKGPRKWQREELSKIHKHIIDCKLRQSKGLPILPYKLAVVSGRGTGKSALVAWIILWHMSTHLGSTAIITANTEEQLKSKTWAELGRWHTMSINSHWFERGALSFKPALWFETVLKDQLKLDTGYYYANGNLWSEDNPDAFAGAHNHEGMLVIFDEASGIPKPIWTVTAGFFTEESPYRFWMAFSNGRRNTGAFFECFHKNREEWPNRTHLDSRTVEGVDHAELNAIVREHGEDSDEARIEVKGEFPEQSSNQFIGRGLVEAARTREVSQDSGAPLIMGVDPARFGDDSTVIRFRQGRDARTIPPVKLKGKDNMAVANKCAELIDKHNPDAVCVDAGNGTGIIDRLREMGYKVHEVWFGGASTEPEYVNNRTDMWAKMRDWLSGGSIDDDQELVDDLTAPEYKFQGGGDKIMLESKESMKRRGFSSPDNGDALACTFAVNVARKDKIHSKGRRSQPRIVKGVVPGFF